MTNEQRAALAQAERDNLITSREWLLYAAGLLIGALGSYVYPWGILS